MMYFLSRGFFHMGWDYKPRPRPRTRFPFTVEFGGRQFTVTGLHSSERLYITDDPDTLLLLSDVPPEPPEPVRIATKSTHSKQEPQKQWRRQGFFKHGPDAARNAGMARQ